MNKSSKQNRKVVNHAAAKGTEDPDAVVPTVEAVAEVAPVAAPVEKVEVATPKVDVPEIPAENVTVVTSASVTAVTDHNVARSVSELFSMREAAFKYRVKAMEERMGPGIKCDFDTASACQAEFSRTMLEFVQTVPPEEVRQAITSILTTYKDSPVLGVSTLMRGLINTRTGISPLPEWFKEITLLFSTTSDESVRFKTVGVTFDITKLSPGIPAVFLRRVSDYFRA